MDNLYSEAKERTKQALESGELKELPRFIYVNKNYEIVESSEGDVNPEALNTTEAQIEDFDKYKNALSSFSPVSRMLPSPDIQPTENLASGRITSGKERVSVFKRQRTSENWDLNKDTIPRTRNTEQNIHPTPMEEDKSEVELINELKSKASKSKGPISNQAFPGLKTVSESITSSFAQKLKENEEEIKNLEIIEESKIIDSSTDETSLNFQKSIYKNHKPFLYEEAKERVVKCFCNDTYKAGPDKWIQCSKCGVMQHMSCVEKQIKLKPYICVFWQFLLMDLINIPIDMICPPAKLSVVDNKVVKFEVKPEVTKLLHANKDKYSIELRGLRLNTIPFKNWWPHYGNMGLDGADWSQTLTLPEREQSRKRKDEPFNLTPYFKNRFKRSHVLALEKKRTPKSHEKNAKNNDPNCYVIGIFLIRKLQIPQIVEYHKKFEHESFISTYNMIWDRLFPNEKEDEIHVISDELRIPMNCPITLKEIKLPAKGYKCAHVEVSFTVFLTLI